ncbi:SDR family oxidoreductase [Bradyrhizobium jicamae]|uniref:SDR family oxidoreductase n=1 Tax=Bradyrhizobium jicamae TaxID=280332 RepID=A0ABS5FKV5_9BRAD|nr:SDR family oxidoreductase [Bradyrhizobium jicamae]MBR0797410.1 SDR family oxidoreductase [Bradyrhizobium jicamae]MBR0939021.1 SDR family oxidoreductase [Bradyrhizobium jicamae]
MNRRARTVIITGASAGIGRAIAARFAQAGDRVGLIARDQTALEAVQRELLASGARDVEWEAVDVCDAAALFAAADRLERRLGLMDIWINDAMETVFSTVADIDPTEFRRVTEVTYLGFVHGTMAALKSMRLRRRGRIIQIGSALAYRGIPLQSAYCGAKHAMRGFTNSLRAELLHEKSPVTVSVIELPAVNTPQFDWARAHIPHAPRPMGVPVEPEVVADAVFRVAEGSSREYWLGWQTILTILGNSVVPAYLDRYLARKAVAGQQTSTPLPAGRDDNLDHPVTALHRTRGSFSVGSSLHAMLIDGELARAACVIIGATLFLVAGAAVARRRRPRSPRPPNSLRHETVRTLRARRAVPLP